MRDLISLLQYEARVKPHIKEYLDNIENYSESDIDTFNVPLPWFKQAFKLYKQKQEEFKRLNDPTNFDFSEIKIGEYNVSGVAGYIISDHSPINGLVVPAGTYVFLEGSTLWWGSTAIPYYEFTVDQEMKRLDYLKEYENKLIASNPILASETYQSERSIGGFGFRVQR